MHLGLIDCFVWDLHTDKQRVTDEEETLALLKEIHHEIVKDDERLIYKHNVSWLNYSEIKKIVRLLRELPKLLKEEEEARSSSTKINDIRGEF